MRATMSSGSSTHSSGAPEAELAGVDDEGLVGVDRRPPRSGRSAGRAGRSPRPGGCGRRGTSRPGAGRRRRLDERRVPRVDHDPALVDQAADRAVGEDGGDRARAEVSQGSGWSVPSTTVTAWPVRCTRSPWSSVRTSRRAATPAGRPGRRGRGARPVGREGGVRAAGHRVLGDAVGRREEARDEVVLAAGSAGAVAITPRIPSLRISRASAPCRAREPAPLPRRRTRPGGRQGAGRERGPAVRRRAHRPGPRGRGPR